MSYAAHVLELPIELQRPILRITESLEKDMREQLAVRREDILSLRAEFVEAQRRSEARFARIEATLAELVAAQKQAEVRLSRVEAVLVELAEAQKRTEQRVEELAEAQKRTEQRVEELAEAQKRTEQRVEELAEAQKRTEVRVGRLVGNDLERRYRERAATYLAKVVKRVRVVGMDAIMPDLERQLTEPEIDDLLSLDLLIQGQVRGQPEAPEVWLACEVSSVVDRNDVRRAAARAGLLRKAGLPALAVVAGEDATEGALAMAKEDRVFVMQDGRRLFWDEALAVALAA